MANNLLNVLEAIQEFRILEDPNLQDLSWSFGESTEFPTTRIEVDSPGFGFWHDGNEPFSSDFDQNDQIIERQMDRSGLHALAWYEPFHPFAYGWSNQWGVFIKASSLEYLARLLRRNGLDAGLSFNEAFKFLLNHELGHFEMEHISAQAELTASACIYLGDLVGVKRSSLGYSSSEEGLCNRIALDSSLSKSRKHLRPWLNSMPVGYSDWKRHIPAKRALSWAEAFRECRKANPSISIQRNLSIVTKALEPPVGIYPPSQTNFSEQKKFVPVTMVLDGTGSGGWIAGALSGPLIPEETRDFKKDLFSTKGNVQLQAAWAKTRRLMEAGVLAGSVHVEPLQGFPQNTYSVRVEGSGIKGARAGLVREGNHWYAVTIDQQHDRFYKLLKNKSPFKLDV